MPTNYDFKRLIGFFVTDSGPDILAFTQIGDYFRFIGDVINDVSDNTITSGTYEAAALSVPPNSLAHIYGDLGNAGETSTVSRLHIRTAGAADSSGSNQEAWARLQTSGTFDSIGVNGMVLVDGSSQVEYTAFEGAGTATVSISTFGCTMLTRSNPV